MGITEAKAMAPADLEYTEDHVQRAHAEADKAYQHAVELSDRAIEGGKGAPAATEVLAAHADADLARKRAERVSQRADRAKAAKRLLDLEALRADIDAFAVRAAAGDGITAALAKVTAAREEFLGKCAAHNAELAALRQRATALNAENLPLNGELSAASAYVHHAFGGLRTASAQVHPLDQRTARHAAQLAGNGDQRGALLALGTAAEIYQQAGQ